MLYDSQNNQRKALSLKKSDASRRIFLQGRPVFPEAKEGLAKLKRSEPAAYQKAVKLLKKHRLVYRIFEQEVHVDVLTTYGHYGDK